MLGKGTLWLTLESSVLFSGKQAQEISCPCMLQFSSTLWSHHKCLGKKYLNKSFWNWTCALLSWFNFRIRQWQILVASWDLLFFFFLFLPSRVEWGWTIWGPNYFILSWMCWQSGVLQDGSPCNPSKKYVWFCGSFNLSNSFLNAAMEGNVKTNSWSQMGFPELQSLMVAFYV